MAQNKMKALLFRNPGSPLELAQLDVPSPGPRQVRIKVAACGICHSDLFVQQNALGNVEFPRAPGHEVVGTIDAVGSDVNGWSTGRKVGVGWDGGHCFGCPPCREGAFVCCRNLKIPGFSYHGGYAEYMIAPIEALASLPDGFGFAEAAPLLCAGVTTYNALRNSGARPGDLVAIQGIGGLGHLGIQFASRSGFNTVAISRGKESEQFAREMGARAYIDSSAQDPAKELQKLGGAKAILATAPNAKAISGLVGGLGVDGTLVTIAAVPEPLELATTALIQNRIRIQGWPSGSSKDSEDTLRFALQSGVKPMVEKFPLEKGPEGYERMLSGKAKYRVVLTMA